LTERVNEFCELLVGSQKILNVVEVEDYDEDGRPREYFNRLLDLFSSMSWDEIDFVAYLAGGLVHWAKTCEATEATSERLVRTFGQEE
jgi:hypothetical protein